MKKILLYTLLFSSTSIFAQSNYHYADEQEEELSVKEVKKFESKYELGFDGAMSASNFGGSFGLGVKLGKQISEELIVGVSGRWMRSWNKYYNSDNVPGFNVLGGGIWGHYRLENIMYLGAEFELLSSPYKFTIITPKNNIYPTLLLGGGISKAWDSFRINAGIYYDVIDNANSPFRTSYFIKRQNNTYLPVIYRVGFFFTL